MNIKDFCLYLEKEVDRAHDEGRVELRSWCEDLIDNAGFPLHPNSLYAFAEKLSGVARRIERTTNAYQGAKRASEIIPTD